MKKQLLCWGLSAWLALWQCSPAFAAGSVSSHAEADPAEEEETTDADAAFDSVPSAPDSRQILLPDGDKVEEKQNDVPPMDSGLSAYWEGNCYGMGSVSGLLTRSGEVSLDSSRGHTSSGVSTLPNVSEPAGDAAHAPANEPAPDALPVALSSSSVRFDQAMGGNPVSGSVAYDNAVGGISIIAGTPAPESEPKPTPTQKWLWPPDFGQNQLQANSFLDLEGVAYALDAIAWAVSNGVATGRSDTTFAPKEPCTHNHILAFLWRICGAPTDNSVTESPFEDITNLSAIWFHIALWAEQNGLRSADKDGNFNGNDPCTRAEAMRYIWLLSGSPAPSERASFTDLPTQNEYVWAISWAVEMGITTGRTSDTFAPKDGCSRANIVTFLYRAWNADVNGSRSD